VRYPGSSLWFPILLEAGSSKICPGPVANATGVLTQQLGAGHLGR